MKKIEFTTLQMAVDHAKQFGGWIFHNENENISIWYDASIYTMTMILNDSPGSGTVGMWSQFEKIDDTQITNNLDKKVMKKVDELVQYCKVAEFTYTQEDIIEKFTTIVESNEEEAALNSLDATLKQMKRKAKERENLIWNKVKTEIFNKNGSVPTSIRDLKSMIKNNEININGIESQNWVEKQIEIKVIA